jgi:hypothetical protein
MSLASSICALQVDRVQHSSETAGFLERLRYGNIHLIELHNMVHLETFTIETNLGCVEGVVHSFPHAALV